MSCQETYWCHTLIEQKQSRKNKKISPKTQTVVDCTFRVDVSQWWKAKFLNRVPTWNVFTQIKNDISKFWSSSFENAMISMINCFQYFCIRGTLKQFKDNLIVDRGTCLNKGNYYTFKCCSNVLDEIFCITDIYFLYIIITTRTNWKKTFGIMFKVFVILHT